MALAETGFRCRFCWDTVCQELLDLRIFSDLQFDIRHLPVMRAGYEILLRRLLRRVSGPVPVKALYHGAG